jgi:hypothetical protein
MATTTTRTTGTPPSDARGGGLSDADAGLDPQLAALLEAISRDPCSEEARAVLLDWALENGRDALSDWMREEARRYGEPVDDDPGFREVAEKVAMSMRVRLARGPIAACGVDACPGRWEALEGTGITRRCATCARSVSFHDSDDVPPTEPHVLAPSLPSRMS